MEAEDLRLGALRRTRKRWRRILSEKEISGKMSRVFAYAFRANGGNSRVFSPISRNQENP